MGHNFFLEQQSLGQNRAEEVSRLVAELNPDVKARAIKSDLINHLRDESLRPEDELQASLFIGVGLEEADELELAERCWTDNTPLILVQTCGFVGLIRSQVKELGRGWS